MEKDVHKNKKWHPYFAAVLSAMLEPMGFKVETEIEVGKLPLKIDIVVVRKEKIVKTKLPAVFSSFNDHNIIEYKSPNDVLDIDSFDKLFAYALLYKIKEKIGSRAEINTYAYVSGDIAPIREYILANNHKLETVKQGIYYSNFGFNFYLIKLDEVPEKKEYIELLLFGKRESIKELIEAILFYGNDTVKEVIKTSSELYPEILKEVLNMPKVLGGNKKVIDEALRNFIDSVGKEKIINSIGEGKIINSIGEDKIINRIGKEKFIEILGEKKLQKLLDMRKKKKI